ncbi:MAG: DUF4920 domain-containing protein [Candidatus Schekmanbacteria bacterium]|nr:DUF4920 domain-containing protein [Candidatus Schekmanbacteria bacterium]
MGEAAAIHRGAPLKPGDEVALSALLGDPQSFQGRAVRTSGIVSQVCQNRGCWMELTPRDGGRGIRVTFKDYAFFVPRDAKSAAATCEGEVVVETLSAADAEHLKSEGATVATDENGAAREVRFVATGVELTRAKNL